MPVSTTGKLLIYPRGGVVVRADQVGWISPLQAGQEVTYRLKFNLVVAAPLDRIQRDEDSSLDAGILDFELTQTVLAAANFCRFGEAPKGKKSGRAGL